MTGFYHGSIGKAVLAEMFASGQSADDIVKAKGLAQVSDEDAIASAIDKVLTDNPDQVKAYLGGKETVAKWFFGQVMRGMGGKSNPGVVQRVLEEKLNPLKRVNP